MKTCCTCKTEKPTSEFTKNRSNDDGFSKHCRSCSSEIRKRHYQENRSKIVADVAARQRSLREQIWQVKVNGFCLDCGESDPVVLEFDHTSDDKMYNISEMPQRGFSWSKIESEIAKCDLVCANCHRRRTHQRNSNVSLVLVV